MMAFARAGGHGPGGRGLSNEELLLELSKHSPLLVVLRTLYSLMLDYGVYLADDGSALIFSKEQIVVLVERGRADALVKDLPDLAAEGMLRPMRPEELAPEEPRVLVLERAGARVLPLSGALASPEPEYPQWWEAPIPFALCARGGMKLNPTAAVMFGRDLERLTLADLPEKDEFIVELEGKGRPCFLSFRRLEPNIFTIDDCTSDLVEAQDISWWAAVGRAWTSEIEAGGQTWQRLGTVPEGFEGRTWPCEWQGRFQGYLCVEGEPPPAGAAEPAPSEESPAQSEALEPVEKPKKRARRASSSSKAAKSARPKKEDEVLKAIGPQTMALLAAGQVRDEDPEPLPEAKKPRARARKVKDEE